MPNLRTSITRHALLAAALAAIGSLSGSLAFAQQAPAPPATPPPAAGAPQQAGPPPGMRHGDPGGQQDGRSGMAPNQFHGGQGFQRSGMHGEPGMEGGRGMGEGFRIVPPGMWWKNPGIVQKLTLTPDQVKRMDDIFQASRIQLIDLKATLEKQQVLLDPMLNANPPDTVKTLAQIDKVAQARADLEKGNAKMLLGIRGVLTPEQWTKLNTRGPGPQQ